MNNIKTIVLSLILFIAVIGALVWFGGKNREPQTAAIDNETTGGILTAKEVFYDFGSVKINGGFVNHEYALLNASDKIVKIDEVSTSCMCTTAELKIGDKAYGPFGMPGHGGGFTKAGVIINPGEKIIVKAIFDPAAHGPAGIGLIEREIYLNTGSKEPVVLKFKANITP